jgi:hypothetical protein
MLEVDFGESKCRSRALDGRLKAAAPDDDCANVLDRNGPRGESLQDPPPAPA